MAVDDQDSSESLLRHCVENVAQDRHVRFDTQRDRSWKRAKVGRDAVRQDWKHRHAQRLCGFNRQSFRQDAIHTQAQVSVLFRASKGQHCTVIALQIFFHHHPIHFADPHITRCPTDVVASRRFV